MTGDETPEHPEAMGKEAVVTRTVTSQGEGVFIRIVGFDGEHGDQEFGPCPWGPPFYQVGNDIVIPILPQRGDRALAIQSDGPAYWVTNYWPFGGDVD